MRPKKREANNSSVDVEKGAVSLKQKEQFLCSISVFVLVWKCLGSSVQQVNHIPVEHTEHPKDLGWNSQTLS